MSDKAATKVVNVSIDPETRAKLKDYCENARPRIFMTDAVSLAVDEWVDRQIAKNEGGD